MNPRESKSLLDSLNIYLKDISPSNYPKLGVVGMAGPVCNNTVSAVNINHWPTSDGNAIAEELKLDSFVFINDFTAAGYGVATLRKQDVTVLGHSGDAVMQTGARSVKVVIGPGTGLG
jgi:glucokinase